MILVPDPPVVAATPPPASTLFDDLWETLPDYVPAADDGTLAAYLNSAVAPVEPVVAALASGAGMVDPWTVPSDRLPWVAALAGVDLTGIPADQIRPFLAGSTIVSTSVSPFGAVFVDTYTGSSIYGSVVMSRFRGCRMAIQQRVAFTLTGAKTVQVECPLEGDPLAMLVRTWTVETPDPAATAAAIRAEVPAWLALTIDVASGMDYDGLASEFDDYDAMTGAGGTYNDLSTLTP